MATNRMIAHMIVEKFEELLDRKGIEIPCDNNADEKTRHDSGNTAKLYGMEYWELVGEIERLLG